MTALVLFAAPAAAPLTAIEVIEHCRLEDDAPAAELEVMIGAATTAAERITRRALVTQTWDLYLDRFPCWEMHIPKPKLQSVTSIIYTDTDGVQQTLAADQYRVDLMSEPARIEPAYGVVWPTTRSQSNAVKVRFVCGYGAPGEVPEGIKAWMKLRIRHAYDNRGVVNVGAAVNEFPRAFVDGLLDDFAVPTFDWAL